MPVPKPRSGEKQDDFMARCMHEVSKNPDRPQKQNVAICMNTWREAHGGKKSAGKSIDDMPNRLALIAKTTGKINASERTITGVSVISEGEILGHGLYADAKTLASVKACAETYEGGLKVKLDHVSSIGAIIGFVDNFSIDGTQLRGDLHLLQNSEQAGYVLELAKTVPEQVGMSIVFSYETEMCGDQECVRCLEIYSCDLVDSPAANATGLFSAKNSKNMKKVASAQSGSGPGGAKEPAPATYEKTPHTTGHEANVDIEANPEGGHPREDEDYRANNMGILSERLSALETIMGSLAKSVDELKGMFEAKLSEAKKEFESQLKDANILAARKLAATGIPASRVPAENGGNVVDFNEALLALKDPRDQMEFYTKNKDKIHASFARKNSSTAKRS